MTTASNRAGRVPARQAGDPDATAGAVADPGAVTVPGATADPGDRADPGAAPDAPGAHPAGGTAAWSQYQAAARRLGEVRRRAAAVAAEREAAAHAVGQELTTAYRRVALQRSRVVDTATRAGVPVPPLTPGPAEVADALAAMTAPSAPADGSAPSSGGFATGRAMAPGMISQALREATVTLDTADAALSATGTGRPGSPAPGRNALVYGAFALMFALAQVPLVLAPGGGLFSYCGLVTPLIAFPLGWLTVGVAFRAPPGGRVDRTPVLGALISLFAAAPVGLVLLSVLVSALRG